MGTWGPGIFDDDIAADVRDAYRDLIEDGVPDGEATKRVLSRYEASPDHLIEDSVVWLALASTQHTLGRLEPYVRDRALRFIEHGEDLLRWTDVDADLLGERRKVLERLRTQLVGPQPKRKRVRKPKAVATKLRVGDIIAYRGKNGRIALLRVQQLMKNRLEIGPLMKAFEFDKRTLPDLGAIRRLRDLPTPPLAARLDTPSKPWSHVTFYATLIKGVDFDDAGFTLVGNIGSRPDNGVTYRDLPEGTLGTSWLRLGAILERYLSGQG